MRIKADAFGACIERISARGKISKNEALDLLNEVADRGDKMRRSGEADPFVTAAGELATKLKDQAIADRTDGLRNAILRDRVLADVDRAGGIAKAEAELRSILHGTNAGGRDSIESAWRGNAAAWQAQLSWALRKGSLEKTAISGDADAEIARELWAINAGERSAGENSPARAIAQAIAPLLDHVRDRLNAAGARIGDATDYVAHTLHDPAKLRRAAGPGATPEQAFDAWWRAVEPKLSDKTFDDVKSGEREALAMARRRFGKSVFDALVSGIHMTAGGAGDEAARGPAFEGTSNLARKVSRQRVLFWKDGEAWQSYMRQFGASRSIAEGVMLTLDRSARQLALMERLGTNPTGNFNVIVRRLQETYRDDLDGVKAFKGKIAGLDAVMAQLDGRANMPANEMWARLGSGVRVWESLSHLGSVGVTHAASIWPTVSSELIHHGQSRLATLGRLAQALLRGRGSDERQELLSQLGAYSDGLSRDMFARWQPEDTLPGRLSSVANIFMKYTGIRYLFDNTQAAVREMLANHLARNVDKAFADLDPHLAQMLGKYGIDAPAWDLLRAVDDLPKAEGRSYLTPRDAQRIDPVAAEAMLRARGQLSDDVAPDEVAGAVRNLMSGLSDKLYSYYGDAAAHAVVTAGVRERAMVLSQERPGSFGGELRRYIAQFKMWPLAVMNQVIGREIHMSLSRREAVWNLGVLAALSTASGYTRMAINDLAVGKEPRNPLDAETLAEALAQGGGLGVMGDFLFGEAARMNGGLVGALGGPAIGDADQLVKIFGQWKQGKAGWPQLARFSVNHVPFANLIYLKGALDYLLWFHLYEAASPGWWERTNRRLERERKPPMAGYVPGQGIPWTPWAIGAGYDQGDEPASVEPTERQSRRTVRAPTFAANVAAGPSVSHGAANSGGSIPSDGQMPRLA